jgi:CheY-like chemotaxis protein
MHNVLIVDDEPEANRLLAMIVQLGGHRTRSAFTGEQALSLARDEPPDVVLLDLMLPDLDGFAVCRELRAATATSLVPIVVVSARLAERNRVQSFEAGAVDFVPKPFLPEQIFHAIDAAQAWRRELEAHSGTGEIAFRDRDLVEFEGRLVGVRCLLRSRTSLDPDDIDAIALAARRLREAARSWGQHRAIDHVATLTYRLGADRLTLIIRDEAGWFEGGHPPLSESIRSDVLRRGLFDEISSGPSGRELTLCRRFPASASP